MSGKLDGHSYPETLKNFHTTHIGYRAHRAVIFAIAWHLVYNFCNSGALSGSFIPLVIHVCLGFVPSVSVSDVRSHSIIGLYVLLFLLPVRGQSALGWFINNNNNDKFLYIVVFTENVCDTE